MQVAVLHRAPSAPLGRCLESLRRQSCRDFELWIGDNASSNPLLDGLVNRDHGEHLVRFPRNLGFAAGNNALLARPGASGAAPPFVAFVNDDVELAPDWLELLIAAMAAGERLGALQGTLIQGDPPAGPAGDLRVEGTGLEWTARLEVVPRHQGLRLEELGAAALLSCWGVSATAALYRRAALAATALADGTCLDNSLFAYYEDVELALRLHRGGWQSACVPAALARHAGSATGNTMPAARHRWIASNRWLTLARHFAPRFLARRAGAILAADGAHAAILARRHDWSGLLGLAGAPARALALLPRFAAPRRLHHETPKLEALPVNP